MGGEGGQVAVLQGPWRQCFYCSFWVCSQLATHGVFAGKMCNRLRQNFGINGVRDQYIKGYVMERTILLPVCCFNPPVAPCSLPPNACLLQPTRCPLLPSPQVSTYRVSMSVCFKFLSISSIYACLLQSTLCHLLPSPQISLCVLALITNLHQLWLLLPQCMCCCALPLCLKPLLRCSQEGEVLEPPHAFK